MTDKRLLTVEEAAYILNVKRHTVYRWIYAGKIKSVRLGSRTVRIDSEELERFIKGGKENG